MQTCCLEKKKVLRRAHYWKTNNRNTNSNGVHYKYITTHQLTINTITITIIGL